MKAGAFRRRGLGQTGWEGFAAAYATAHSITFEGSQATLILGRGNWPFPIPAVQGPRGWTLDTEAGRIELLARRVGQNELDVVEVVRAIVDAQHEYASEVRNADGLRSYAARFVSTRGTHDGLYWPAKDAEEKSPLGPIVGAASAQGYSSDAEPFHGYRFRLLTAQGKSAPGGARSYLVRGKLLGGFAVIAYPASYGNSGIMTFIANQDGIVHQKDLGANTPRTAQAMKVIRP